MKNQLLVIIFLIISSVSYGQYILKPEDVTFNNGVLEKYLNTTENDIIIPDNFGGVDVTSIGNRAFYGKQVTKVVVPNTVTVIGERAFQSSKLTDITLSEGLSTISLAAFHSSKLTSIIIPNSVTTIGVYAFYRNELESVTLPSSLTTIKEGSFQQNKISSIEIPNLVTVIEKEAFNFNQLSNVVFHNSIDSIGAFAFAFNKLTSISIPNNLTVLEQNVFNSNQLTSISIPNTVKTIVSGAFGFNELTEITIPSSVISLSGFNNNKLTSITIPNTVETIGVSAFSNNYLTNVTIGENVNSIGQGAFGFNQLTEVIIPTKVNTIGKQAFWNNQLTSIAIPNSISIINQYVFATNKLKSVTLPNSVITIDRNAFWSNELTSLTIPNSVTTIDRNAFQKNKLTTLIIPNNVTVVEQNAFSNNELSDLTLGENLAIIGNYAFSNNKLSDIQLPTNVTYLGTQAFSSNELTSLKLPENHQGNTHLWTDSWKGNTYHSGSTVSDFSQSYTIGTEMYILKLSDVVFENGEITAYINTTKKDIIIPNNFGGESVTSVATQAFRLKGLTSLILPNTLTTIDEWAFGYNELKVATIPNSVTFIDKNAFRENDLKQITIPNSLTTIEEGVFAVNQLETLVIPTTITTIGKQAFAANKLKSLTIPNSVTSIQYGAFDTNELTEVTIPNSITVIEERVFAKNKLTEVNFPNSITTIGKNSFIVNQFKTMTIPNSVTTIKNGAFQQNPIESLDLPNSLITIEQTAFWNNKLTEVTIPNSVTYIGTNAFAYNELTSFHLPENHQGKFYMWTDGTNSFLSGDLVSDLITNYTLGEEIYTLTINDVIFDNGEIKGYVNTTEKSIAIPDSFDGIPVTSIGTEAFQDKGIINVKLPNSLTSIKASAFNNPSLTIKLPNSKEGYSSSWYDGTNYFDAGIYINDLTKTYNAEIKLLTYTISHNLNGGLTTNSNSYTIESETIILSDASKDGYFFEGWYLDAEFENQVTKIESGSTGNIELYAKFSEPIIYSLSYNLEAITNNNPATYTVESSLIILTSVAKPNYIFEGWYLDTEFENQVVKIESGSTGDIELYANFTPEVYDITYNANGGLTTNPSSYTVESETIILSDASNDGYRFEGWYLDAKFENQVTKIETGLTGDIKLYAKFSEPIIYSLSYNLEVITNNNPATYTVESSLIILTSVAKPNYIFEGWYLDTEFENQVVKIESGSTGDVELYAKFTPEIYDIKYNANGGLTTNPNSYTIESKTIVLSDASKDGYLFEGWYLDAVFENQVMKIESQSTGDIELYAKFSDPIIYNLSYVFEEGTHNNPNSYTIETLPLILEELELLIPNYLFEGWYLDNEFSTEITEIPVGSIGDLSLFAKVSKTLNSLQGLHDKRNFYPNPASDFIHVISDELTSIYSLNGTLILTSEQIKIDISNLETGLYIIKQGQRFTKFIKR